MQISQHINNEKVRNRVGLLVTLADMISCRRLRWLGHVARISDDRLPKQLLFGWLSQCHGCCRDKFRRNLKAFQIDEVG